MQLSGPLFLFLFFPLSFALVLPVPQKFRPCTFTLLSALWYVLANLQSPVSIGVIALLAAWTLVLSRHPSPQGKRALLALGITPILAAFFVLRILFECHVLPFAYPMGMGLVSLGALSVLLDGYRGDAERRPAALVLHYLLFFPALTLGPIVRWAEITTAPRTIAPSLERFCSGARLYMAGFIKRLVAAATLFHTIAQALNYGARLPWLTLAFFLPLAYFFVFFFLSGSADLARGVSAMYGVQDPVGSLPAGTPLPQRLLTRPLPSLTAYFEHYVAEPLRARTGRVGALLSPVLVLTLTLLLFRMHPSVLLAALPLAVWTLASVCFAPKTLHRGTRAALHIICTLLCSLPLFAMLLANPSALLSRFEASTSEVTGFFYYINNSASGTRYLLIGAILLLLYTAVQTPPLRRIRHVHGRAHTVLEIGTLLLLFAGFLIALIYFLPQMPYYAEHLGPAPIVLGGA